MGRAPVLALLLAAGQCGDAPTEAEIKAEIERARGCALETECENVGSKCPFGCAIVVHRDQAARIRELVNGFASGCVYDCLAVKAIVCEKNLCTAK